MKRMPPASSTGSLMAIFYYTVMNTSITNEDMILQYFNWIKAFYKPTSLRVFLSRLKIDLEKYEDIKKDEFECTKVKELIKELEKKRTSEPPKTFFKKKNLYHFLKNAPDERYILHKVSLIKYRILYFFILKQI